MSGGTSGRPLAPDICAFAAFPASRWRRIWSTNPLERVNAEIKRLADVIGIFLNPEAIVRLTGAVWPLAVSLSAHCFGEIGNPTEQAT